MDHHTGSVPDWRTAAACRTEDPEIFFVSDRTAAGKADVRHAKTICWACPSRQPCGQWGLETREPFGLLGGMTPEERRAILRRRGIRIKDIDPDKDTPAEDPKPRNKGGRPPAECGTRSAYQRHVTKGEPIDDACRATNSRASARLRRTGTTKTLA